MRSEEAQGGGAGGAGAREEMREKVLVADHEGA